MKKLFFFMSVGAMILTLAAGCKNETTKTGEAPETPDHTSSAPAPAPSQGKSGTVIETMNAAGYTYVQVDTGSEKIWAAAPEFQVKTGDTVAIPEGMPMPNYHSKTLNKDFEVVYFVPSVMVGGAEGILAAKSGDQLPSGHPTIETARPTEVDLSGIVKAEGGKTVAEIYAGKTELVGQQITLRGKVVKFSPEIMKKNWIHLQDGTGAEGTNDLTVTTGTKAQVGDSILVTGILTADKDFGYGYKYDLIIEDGQVTIE